MGPLAEYVGGDYPGGGALRAAGAAVSHPGAPASARAHRGGSQCPGDRAPWSSWPIRCGSTPLPWTCASRADLPPLGADPHQLQQVLVNLLTNAQQALRAAPAPRQVTLTTQYDPARTGSRWRSRIPGRGFPRRSRRASLNPSLRPNRPGWGLAWGCPCARGSSRPTGHHPGHEPAWTGTTFRVALPVGVVPESATVSPRHGRRSAPRPQQRHFAGR